MRDVPSERRQASGMEHAFARPDPVMNVRQELHRSATFELLPPMCGAAL